MIIDNLDGTSTAVWDFTTPSDHVFSDTGLTSGCVSLKRQSDTWWNSTTAADFASSESETNIDRVTSPGDVTMALTSGPGILLTLQPGATGEVIWLDKNNPGMNHGSETTMMMDVRNPNSRPLMRFDIPAIPANAVIDGAQLGIYQSNSIGNSICFYRSTYISIPPPGGKEMRIKKTEEKPDKEEKSLAAPDNLTWPMYPFRDLDRYFDMFFMNLERDFPEFRGRFFGPRLGPRFGLRWIDRGTGLALKPPAMDLKDNGKEFLLRAELPGVTKDDVDITIHGDSIEIDAKRESATEEEHEGYYFKEIGKSSYYRRIPLPEEVEAEKAQGMLENGVLELTLPKLKPSESKAHKVKL